MDRKDLIKILELLKPGVNSGKNAIENADKFVFEEDKVYSFNDTIQVQIPIETGIIGAINESKLYPFLKKGTKDELKLSVKDNELIIKCGRSRAGFKMEEVEFDLPERVEGRHRVT